MSKPQLTKEQKRVIADEVEMSFIRLQQKLFSSGKKNFSYNKSGEIILEAEFGMVIALRKDGTWYMV